jgi:hypothetical protein
MVVAFIPNYAISPYHHQRCEFESHLVEVRSIQHYVIKFVSHLQQVGAWFSLGTPVSSTNKTDHHDMTSFCLQVDN